MQKIHKDRDFTTVGTHYTKNTKFNDLGFQFVWRKNKQKRQSGENHRGELEGVREVRDLGGRENGDVDREESHKSYYAYGAR